MLAGVVLLAAVAELLAAAAGPGEAVLAGRRQSIDQLADLCVG